ncbi:MAG TPA: hypothetical protein VFP84_37845 [Kofleriaceae bacterium]|nr:hypothetical protein [Kofleriaceae bacterium]
MFNRFSTQIVRVGKTQVGPSFFNTATKTHMQSIPNAIAVRTGSTRILQDPAAPAGMVRCASDNAQQPALYIQDPVDDLCLICPKRAGACIATTPVILASREDAGWRVLRIDLTGEHAEFAGAWERQCYMDWDLEYEADLSIGLDAQTSVQLHLSEPRRLSPHQAGELRALYIVLHHLSLPAAMIKGGPR